MAILQQENSREICSFKEFMRRYKNERLAEISPIVMRNKAYKEAKNMNCKYLETKRLQRERIFFLKFYE